MSRRIDILTLFPEMFDNVLGSSILRRAAEPVPNPANPDDIRPPVVSYHLTNIRDHTDDKHQKVDQPPFGGGPGMVIQCQPVFDAVHAAQAADPRPARRILMTPQGKPLNQELAQELAQEPRLLIIAGHYEGIDQRVIDELAPVDEISIGDYVLSGGELPAMVLIDTIVRLLPGALGHEDSAEQDSFTGTHARLLEGPCYTRPRSWRDREVPEVLLSGDHAKIEAWRAERALQRTRDVRPDLLSPTGTEKKDAGNPVCVIVRGAHQTDRQWAENHAKTIENGRFLPHFGQKWHENIVEMAVTDYLSSQIGLATLISLYLAEEPGLRGLLAIEPLILAPEADFQPVRDALIRQCVAIADQAGAAAVLMASIDPPAADFQLAHTVDLSAKPIEDQYLWIKPLRPNKLERLKGPIDWPHPQCHPNLLAPAS